MQTLPTKLFSHAPDLLSTNKRNRDFISCLIILTGEGIKRVVKNRSVYIFSFILLFPSPVSNLAPTSHYNHGGDNDGIGDAMGVVAAMVITLLVLLLPSGISLNAWLSQTSPPVLPLQLRSHREPASTIHSLAKCLNQEVGKNVIANQGLKPVTWACKKQ